MAVRVLNGANAPTTPVSTATSTAAPRTIVVRESDPLIVRIVEPAIVSGGGGDYQRLRDEIDALDVRVEDAEDLGVAHTTALGGLTQSLSNLAVTVANEVSTPRGHRHTQLVPRELWEIEHNLGFPPAGIVIRDSVGDLIEPANISWPNPTTTVYIHFPGVPVSGVADLS